MPNPIDPYHLWLSIPLHDRPANHYRLLGLPLFEDDFEVIRDAAERQLGHLRRYLAGSTSEVAQRLIAEVTQAREELLNPTTKQSYDSQLRRRNPVEVGFLASEGCEQSVGVTPDQMVRLTGHGFDPLHHWLGIPAREQPPTLYGLLGLQPFESDVDVIREGAERQIAHIRKYSLGERRAIAETLLRVLAEARGQLLDAARKQAYDHRLSQLGSVVRRSASGVIEAPTRFPQQAASPVQWEPVSDAATTSDSFQREDLEAIPLPAARPFPTQASHPRRAPWPVWMPSGAAGCAAIVALLLVVLISSYAFINRRGPATVADSPRQPPIDPGGPASVAVSPRQPPIAGGGSSPPAVPATADRLSFEPARRGNPLLDYHRLRIRLDELGIDAVVQEYHRGSSDREVQLVAQALDLSQNVLGTDPAQLWSQLQARSVEVGGVPLSNFSQLRPAAPHWESLTPSLAQAGGPLLRIIKGKNRLDIHRGPFAFTPDGTKLIGLFGHQTLKVWELSTGQEISVLSKHPAWVQAVAVTPDGKTIVSASHGSGSGDNTLKIWDLATGKELHTLAGHDTNIHAIAIAPDGRNFVAGYDRRPGRSAVADTIKLWDIRTGDELRTLLGHAETIKAVAITPDGQQVISVGNRALKVWDLATGAERHSFARSSTIPAFAVSPDSRLVAAWSMGNAIKVWDLNTGNEVQSLIGHQKLLRAIAFTNDGSQVVSSSLDETVKVWDLQSGAATKTFSGHDNMASAIAISPNAQTIVSAAKGNRLLLSSVSDGIGPITLAHNSDATTTVAFAPDSRTVVTATGNAIHVWDASARDTSIRLPEFVPSSPVAISPDGSIIAYAPADSEGYGACDSTIRIWDVQLSSVLTTLAGHDTYAVRLAFSSDSRTLRSTPRSGADKQWNVETGAELGSAEPDAFAEDMASRHVVISDESSSLQVQDRQSGETLLTIPGDHRFAAATLLDDEQTLIAVDRSGAIHRFRVLGLAGPR